MLKENVLSTIVGRIVLCFLTLLVSSPLAGASEPSFFKMQELFKGRGGYSIVVAPDGTPLAFNGNKYRRSTDGGKTWDDSREIGPDAGGNAIVNETTGEILLVKAGGGYLWKSKDNGQSWNREEIKILPDGFGFGTPDGVPLLVGEMQSGITLQFSEHKGRLIMPARILGPTNSNAVEWRPYHYNTAIYSDDSGKTWAGQQTVSGTWLR